MTNYEKIKNMSVEEMAKFINLAIDGEIEIWAGFCDICNRHNENKCWKCTQQWLESEVDKE